MIIIECRWCEKQKPLRHMGRVREHNFCNIKCQQAFQRGHDISEELKTEIQELKTRGYRVKDIQYILQISRSAYYETLKTFV